MAERRVSKTEKQLQDLRYAILTFAEHKLRQQWPGFADKLVEIVKKSQ